MNMSSKRRQTDIVYYIDSDTRMYSNHLVPTAVDFLPFVHRLGCQASAADAFAEEYVVHKLFEPDSELSREQFAVQMMAMLKNRFAKKFPMLPDVYVVYYEGKKFLTMSYRQQQITAPAEMTLPEFVRNRLLGLLPDATATPAWMTVESEFADENIQRGCYLKLPPPRQFEDGNDAPAQHAMMLRMLSDASKCINSTLADDDPALEHTVGVDVMEIRQAGGTTVDSPPAVGEARRATVESLADWESKSPAEPPTMPSVQTSAGSAEAFTFNEVRAESLYLRPKEASLSGWVDGKPSGGSDGDEYVRNFPGLPLAFRDRTCYSRLELAAMPKSPKTRGSPRARVRGALRWCIGAAAFIAGIATALIAPRAQSRRRGSHSPAQRQPAARK